MMLDLGFVAFSGFRAAAEESVAAISAYDADQVWGEFPLEIKVQWRAAADVVKMYLESAKPLTAEHQWPRDDGHVYGPWQMYTGSPNPRQYRTCVSPACTYVDYREYPVM